MLPDQVITNINYVIIACSIVIGYFLGSINSSLIVGHLLGKIDIRQHGSGNAGLTNTLRVLGKKAASFVLMGDILKGIISIFLAKLITYIFMAQTPEAFKIISGNASIFAGIGCILGHNWPIFFAFKGGKGVLTSATVIFMLDWRIGVVLLGLFVIVVGATRFVSLGSTLCALALPLISVYLNKNTYFIIFSIFAALLVVLRHNKNISRLLNGTESKLSFKK